MAEAALAEVEVALAADLKDQAAVGHLEDEAKTRAWSLAVELAEDTLASNCKT